MSARSTGLDHRTGARDAAHAGEVDARPRRRPCAATAPRGSSCRPARRPSRSGCRLSAHADARRSRRRPAGTRPRTSRASRPRTESRKATASSTSRKTQAASIPTQASSPAASRAASSRSRPYSSGSAIGILKRVQPLLAQAAHLLAHGVRRHRGGRVADDRRGGQRARLAAEVARDREPLAARHQVVHREVDDREAAQADAARKPGEVRALAAVEGPRDVGPRGERRADVVVGDRLPDRRRDGALAREREAEALERRSRRARARARTRDASSPSRRRRSARAAPPARSRWTARGSFPAPDVPSPLADRSRINTTTCRGGRSAGAGKVFGLPEPTGVAT